MPAITMLIKPASSLCNLRCKYCFYHDEAASRIVASYGIMSHEILENIVKQAFKSATNSVTFSFQGGEPTLAGISYYEKLFELCETYNTKKLNINYAIQTNGILVADDENWAKLFADKRFLVGISVDGTKEIHDLNRLDINQNGTYKKVIEAVRNLKKYNADFNILTVVNAVTARNITKIYKFYKNQGWRYIQFIPCLDSLDGGSSQDDISLTPQRYLSYMKTLFDLWYADVERGDYISVRHLDNYLSMFLGHPPESCGMLGMCTIQYVIEADGSVYPCDFYVLDGYRLGSINDMDFKDIFECGKAQDFIKESCAHSEKCRKCKWYAICRGGCKRYKNNDFSEYIYCNEIYEFFEYTEARFKKTANKILQRKIQI